MADIDPRTPILVGVGQIVQHWDGTDAANAPSPLGLQVAAAHRALADSEAAGALAALVDRVVVVRSNLGSIPGTRHHFGRCENPPRTPAAELDIGAARCRYSVGSGERREGKEGVGTYSFRWLTKH